MAIQPLLSQFKALSDENRLRIVLALRGGELCACQIVELLGLAPSTVSKHLSILKQAGLIDSRKTGRWMHFRLSDSAPDAGGELLSLLETALAKDKQIRFDRKRLKAILAMDPEELCRRQAGAREGACCPAPSGKRLN